MKNRLNYLLILLCLLIAGACKNGTSSSSSETDEGGGGCEGETAKAILWVDYKRGRSLPAGSVVRTVKVHAKVFSDGTVKVLSFCKKQPVMVENYILKRVAAYTIRKEIFEENYLEPGEQYLQLRYVPEWIK
ncbi:DUF4891 domain-containing protein [Phocaeicola sp.]